MHPELIKIGWFKVSTYGFMLAFSFFAGIFFANYRAKKQNLNTNIVMDLSLIILASGIIGSRVMYVLFHLDEFRGRWLDTINPIQSTGEIGISGLTVIGGFVFAILFALLYLWIKKQNVLEIADIIAPSVALGIFLTRIGCFFNGCCFGQVCEPEYGLMFPHNSPAGSHFPDQAIVPTQLYSSLYGLIIFGILLFTEKKFKSFHGFTFFLLFFLYGIARFVIDFYRYYEHSMVLINLGQLQLSVNQGVSFVLVLVFGFLFVRGSLISRKQYLSKKP